MNSHPALLLLAVAQPPPHRAEYVGIIVGPDPLVLVGSVNAHASETASLPTSASSRAQTTTEVAKMYSLSRPESSL